MHSPNFGSSEGNNGICAKKTYIKTWFLHHVYFIDDTSTSCFWLLFVCVVVSVSFSNIAHKKQVVHRYTIKRLKFDVLASLAHTKSVLYGIHLWHTTFYNEL